MVWMVSLQTKDKIGRISPVSGTENKTLSPCKGAQRAPHETL